MAGARLLTLTTAGFAADPSPAPTAGSKMDITEMMKDKDIMRQMRAQMARALLVGVFGRDHCAEPGVYREKPSR